MVAVSALLAGCAASASAPSAAPPAAAIVVTPELIAQGRTVFAGAGNCAVCHGQNAAGGNFAPDLTDDQWIWVQPQGDVVNQIAGIVRAGIPMPRQYDSPMPAATGLSDAQVQAVAAYVSSL